MAGIYFASQPPLSLETLKFCTWSLPLSPPNRYWVAWKHRKPASQLKCRLKSIFTLNCVLVIEKWESTEYRNFRIFALACGERCREFDWLRSAKQIDVRLCAKVSSRVRLSVVVNSRRRVKSRHSLITLALDPLCLPFGAQTRKRAEILRSQSVGVNSNQNSCGKRFMAPLPKGWSRLENPEHDERQSSVLGK